jgi:hypothetical protein
MATPTAKCNGRKPTSATLLPQHRDELRKSGLSDDQITACAFHTVYPKEAAELLGWKSPPTKMGPFLAIPFFAANGTPLDYVRLKPARPRQKDGKPVKYESPMGKPNRAYFPPRTRPALADPAVPLLMTEGEKKAAKADQEGFPCIGLVGVWGWQQGRNRDNPDAPRELIPDLAAVAWKGRVVTIAYDSDIANNHNVQEAEWRLAQVLRGHGAVVNVLRFPPGPKGEKVGLDDYLVAHGAAELRKLINTSEPASKPKDQRPEVVLVTDEHLSVEKAIEALAKCDKNLYQRGGLLVRVVQPCHPKQTCRLTASSTAKIEAVPNPDLRNRLTRWARIIELKPGEAGILEKHPAHPPGWLVNAVEAAGLWPGVRPLEGVVTAPILLPDGSVLQTPGYHAESGLLYHPPADAKLPRISDKPTAAEVKQAVAEVLEAVCDFPFATPEHRAAWLAALLTPLARFAFRGPAPLFLIDANVRGSGKGLLADVIARIVSGRDFARAAYTTDDDEMRKVIMAIALEGEQLVLLDNLDGALGNPSLDAMLTATEWQGRILGKSQQPRLPLIATWYATGNNVAILADTARRVCHIRLDSLDERPEERAEFRHPDLVGWVSKERDRLLAAALTVLSAYCCAGRPDQKLKAWGSYEGWSDLVRGAVVWLGLPDPGQTRQDLASRSDRDAEALRGLLNGWKEVDPDGEGKTVGHVLALLKDKANADRFPLLREVLAEVCDLPPGKLPSSGRLGCILRKFLGRNVGGVCFDNRPSHGGVQAWLVRAVGKTTTGGDGGDGGDGSPTFRGGGRASPVPDAHARENKNGRSSPPSPPSPPPAHVAADLRTAAALAECEAIIDAALAGPLTSSQRRVAEVLRGNVRTHAAKQDPALWEDAEVLRKQFARWEQGR